MTECGGTPEVEHLVFSGTPRQIGLAHGEACRLRIRALLEQRREILFRERPTLTTVVLKSVCQALSDYTAHRFPELWNEVAATAEGADVAGWEMVIAGAYTDLLDIFRTHADASSRDECTLLVSVTPRFLAGTWDSHVSAADGLILLERRPLKGIPTLALTTAGWPAQQGVNAAGIAFAITNLTPTQAVADGLPYIAANALLAASRTPDEFVKLASSEQFCSGHSYALLGEHGSGWIVETSSAGSNVIPVAQSAAQGNHYRANSPLDDNSRYAYVENSRARVLSLERSLAGIREPTEFIERLLADDLVNRCTPNGPALSAAYFFLEPVERRLWYQRGPASCARLSCTSLS